MNRPVIVWFRLDLRVSDNPALYEAAHSGCPVIPVYIWAPEEEDPPPGSASKWWLQNSLRALDSTLQRLGSRLLLVHGPTKQALTDLINRTNAKAIFWNRRVEPTVAARDKALEQFLLEKGIQVKTFNSATLFELGTIRTSSGSPHLKFTPFWKRCLASHEPSAPLPAPNLLPPPKKWPSSIPPSKFKIVPEETLPRRLETVWYPGENTAQERLKHFINNALAKYETDRDRPDLQATSRLSPHLHFGELSPRQIWHAIKSFALKRGEKWEKYRESQFLAELGWREFAYHLLYHFPELPHKPLRPEFERFQWQNDHDMLERWQKGLTGYPLIDAGMRELLATGWMHNRVRMCVASFLVKDLLTDWRLGAAWFWENLVDADLAINSMNWQWIAGCGVDAAPFFRIFNPTLQAKKYDPEGHYIKQWCPELAHIGKKWIHSPQVVPDWSNTKAATGYPAPIVKHSAARFTALQKYLKIKSKKSAH